jgi:hypothetical protein
MKTATPQRSRIVLLTGLVLVAGLALWLRHRDEVRDASTTSNSHAPSTGKNHRTPSDAPKEERPPARDHKTVHRESLTVDELVAIFEKDGAEAALAAAKGLKGPDRDSQALFILTYIARTDPEWVVKALADAELSIVHQGFVVSAVMEYWEDGEKALAWASGFTGDLRKSAVGMALRILVRTDPEKALAHVDAMPESGSRSQALTDLFVSWGGYDPKAALAAIDQHLPPNERLHAMEIVAGAWASKSPKDALAWIGTIQDKTMSDRLLREAALRWSAVAPEDANPWLATLPDDPVKAGILESLVERERNTIRCGFNESPPDQGWKGKPVAEMTEADLRNWGYQEPAGAKKHLEQATGEIDLSALATTVAAEMSVKEGPSAVFQWAQGLDMKVGDPALRLAVISWAGTHPAEAGSAIEQVAAERRPALASALAEAWSRNDPAAAAGWAASYPGSDQKILVLSVLQQWVGSEPREAYAWLNTLPTGATRDEGISYMIVREAPSDPASLAPRIEMLSTPELREEKRKLLDQYVRRASTEGPHGE